MAITVQIISGTVWLHAGVVTATFVSRGTRLSDRKKHCEEMVKHWFGAVRKGNWKDDSAVFMRNKGGKHEHS